jgi:hypothetical protein
MVWCRDKIEPSRDVLAGEFPAKRVEEFAAQLAQCARYYPQ